MRGFIIGVIVTLLVLVVGGYFYTTTGHFDTRAVGNTPSTFERRTAMTVGRRLGRRTLPSRRIPFSHHGQHHGRLHDLRQKLRLLPWQSETTDLADENKVLPSRAPADDRHAGRSRRQSLLRDQVWNPLQRHAGLGRRPERRRYLEDRNLYQELSADEGQPAAVKVPRIFPSLADCYP